VGGRRHDVCKLERIVCQARCHNTRNVSHVDQEKSPRVVANLSELFVLQISGVSRVACNDHLRLELLCLLVEAVIVDYTRIWVHLVELRVPEQGGCRDFRFFGLKAVSKMATLRQVQAHKSVAGVHDCGVDLEVCRRA